MKKGKRTGVDFSKHEHRVELFKNDEGKEIRVDHFQKGNSRYGYLQFTNTAETLTVTGDYGNWVFCRPFGISEEGSVSVGYWLEKLRDSSSQEPSNYDGDETAKEIKALIKSGLKEYGYEGEELSLAKEFFTDLLTYTEEEFEYVYEAYRGGNAPPFLDAEMIPFCKEVKIWLLIVFDAFDEMCERLKKSKKSL